MTSSNKKVSLFLIDGEMNKHSRVIFATEKWGSITNKDERFRADDAFLYITSYHY